MNLQTRGRVAVCLGVVLLAGCSDDAGSSPGASHHATGPTATASASAVVGAPSPETSARPASSGRTTTAPGTEPGALPSAPEVPAEYTSFCRETTAVWTDTEKLATVLATDPQGYVDGFVAVDQRVQAITAPPELTGPWRTFQQQSAVRALRLRSLDTTASPSFMVGVMTLHEEQFGELQAATTVIDPFLAQNCRL